MRPGLVCRVGPSTSRSWVPIRSAGLSAVAGILRDVGDHRAAQRPQLAGDAASDVAPVDEDAAAGDPRSPRRA